MKYYSVINMTGLMRLTKKEINIRYCLSRAQGKRNSDSQKLRYTERQKDKTQSHHISTVGSEMRWSDSFTHTDTHTVTQWRGKARSGGRHYKTALLPMPNVKHYEAVLLCGITQWEGAMCVCVCAECWMLTHWGWPWVRVIRGRWAVLLGRRGRLIIFMFTFTPVVCWKRERGTCRESLACCKTFP